MTEPIRFCDCGADLSRRAQFCGACGRANPLAVRDAREGVRAADRQHGKAYAALAFVYTGVLLALLVVGTMDLDFWPSIVLNYSLDIAIGCVAALIVGRSVLRRSFGRRPCAVDLAWAAGVAVLSLGAAYSWVGLLQALLPNGEAVDPTEFEAWEQPTLMVTLLTVAVLPALCEEWLCRGVLWQAIRPVSTRGIAILVTALPFACMHLFGGGWVLEIPHRFIMGLLLGWLRARTGSLWPCVLAHFLHNATVVVIDG